jgi:putative transcriptional regulator
MKQIQELLNDVVMKHKRSLALKQIQVLLDEVMMKRKMKLNELAERVNITEANLSILKNNKAKAIRFSTLEALCEALDCQPADLLEYREE